jgi:hypothetical protein
MSVRPGGSAAGKTLPGVIADQLVARRRRQRSKERRHDAILFTMDDWPATEALVFYRKQEVDYPSVEGPGEERQEGSDRPDQAAPDGVTTSDIIDEHYLSGRSTKVYET